jgi:16S rRNA C967 or C1407 C5-methylase (RsmB/RsmF family)
MVYAVCSPEPEESKEVIDRFLNQRHDFTISDHCGGLPAEISPIAMTDDFFQTFPNLTQMDGFSSVRLQRSP